ncbi:MAG: hypothetical protein NUV86_09590 [Candidatus Scalindua sp.]|nr:hypothetical protein [Candidatus Scalindua sp.]
MRAWYNHFPRKLLWEKYNPLIWGPSLGKKGTTFPSFQLAIYKHRDHKDTGVVVVQTTQGSIKRDLTGILNMVDELYARKVETMQPDDITIKDFAAVHKASIDERKLKLDINEQMMELSKLFGIPEIINPLDQGEERAELRPPQDEGNQRKNP